MALSREFVSRMKNELNEQLREIEDELQRLRDFMKGEVDAEPEEGDPDLFEREKTLALIRTQEGKLESVQWALRGIEVGTYGTCERCKEPIVPERLEIKPDAALCVGCQQEVEQRHRLVPGSRSRW